MRIALVVCPSWSVNFPPYNISLLKSILKQNGHEVKNFDFNIEAYHFLKNKKIDFWEGQNYFYWQEKAFDEVVLPKIDSLIDGTIDSILEYNPEFIGFTVYTSNISCTSVMSKRIKTKDSSKKIMMGGPQCFTLGANPLQLNITDYIVTGEGESAILEAIKCPDTKTIPLSKPTNINALLVPDYEDYDITKYKQKNGVSLETSRGCVAKCAFCLETHFWIFRSKKAENVVNEIKECVRKYNVKSFRFNDSLVNGNIKEFHKLVTILSKEKLGITWDGYARIDKKMDLEFMKKIKESGNSFLSYGIESGSQRVLNDMRKGIKVEEAEQNLRDASKVGLHSQVNWIVGFPTEDAIDFLYSLAFLYNNKDSIGNICPGMTCGIGEKAELQVHEERFGVMSTPFLNNFTTKDFKNTIIHRFIRLKLFHIWVSLLDIFNGQNHKNLKDHYSIEFSNKQMIKDKIKYDDCVNFSYLNEDTFSSSLHSEYMNFFWIVYKVFGSFKAVITFDKNRDLKEFGRQVAGEYNSIARFSVDEGGKWELKLVHSLETVKQFDESVRLEGEL